MSGSVSATSPPLATPPGRSSRFDSSSASCRLAPVMSYDESAESSSLLTGSGGNSTSIRYCPLATASLIDCATWSMRSRNESGGIVVVVASLGVAAVAVAAVSATASGAGGGIASSAGIAISEATTRRLVRSAPGVGANMGACGAQASRIALDRSIFVEAACL